MSLTNIGVLGIGLMFILIALGMPIGFSMALAGFAGILYLNGGNIATAILGIIPYNTMASYTFSAVPAFILMGQLIFVSEVSGDLFDAAYHWLGRVRGGIAITTIGACAVFSAACGSSVATAATMGSVALPEMKKLGYKPRYATGAVAAGGTLGILIPPSIPFIIYGVLTEQSIGQLFMAGVIPGIILACLYASVAYIWARISPTVAPPSVMSFTLREKLRSIRKVLGMLVIVFLVMGGIYFGWFTPTEAGAIGAMGAFIITLLKRRINRANLRVAFGETARTFAMVFIILGGAMIFQYFLAITKLPVNLAEFVSGLSTNRYVILFAIIMVYVFLGCLMETLSMVLLTLPVLYPLVLHLGFDPIWFGVIIVIMMELGLITPPIGINVFTISGVAKDVPVTEIFAGVAPFMVAVFIIVAVLVVFPQVALFLPSLMR